MSMRTKAFVIAAELFRSRETRPSIEVDIPRTRRCLPVHVTPSMRSPDRLRTRVTDVLTGPLPEPLSAATGLGCSSRSAAGIGTQ